MEDFIAYLATRKFLLYKNLFLVKDNRITLDDLQKRTERLIRYEETVYTIQHLPYEYQKEIDKDFEEKLEAYK